MVFAYTHLSCRYMDSHGASSPEQDTSVPKTIGVKRVRGAIVMFGLIKLRAEGVRTKVIFDERDNLVGTEGKKFQSYLGTQARTVLIDIQTWKHVPREVKDRIW